MRRLRLRAYPTRPGVQITWANQLVDSNGKCLPRLCTVDQTLLRANPPGRDLVPTSNTTPDVVPIVTHLPGAHTVEESSGYTES